MMKKNNVCVSTHLKYNELLYRKQQDVSYKCFDDVYYNVFDEICNEWLLLDCEKNGPANSDQIIIQISKVKQIIQRTVVVEFPHASPLHQRASVYIGRKTLKRDGRDQKEEEREKKGVKMDRDAGEESFQPLFHETVA